MANEIHATGQVRLQWSQERAIARDAVFNVYANDGAGGAVDYDTAINPQPIGAWPDGEGFASWWSDKTWYSRYAWWHWPAPTSWFWSKRWWDRATWWYGFGGPLRYVTGPLADGDWEFAVVAEDPAGNKTTPAAVTAEITLAGTPQPPTNLQAAAYDDGTDTLTLTWTLSTDDQAA